ncbi:hypothetical protein ANABIO32_13070 [Rossellomorea marisflavi]|nr:hypothetical protein ANABIO32_13070 [Rossellomorea marisflavi]
MVENVYFNQAASGYNVLNGILSIVMLILGLIIIITAIKNWIQNWNNPALAMQRRSA